VGWIVRLIRFHGLRHPGEMGAREVSAFLSDLAAERRVSASTQNLALNALVFLYGRVLERPQSELEGLVRACRVRSPLGPASARPTREIAAPEDAGGRSRA
jgi:hypothetical protein